MTQPIALKSTDKPASQSGSKIVTTATTFDHASIEMYEPQPAAGGSKCGQSIGSIAFQFNPSELTISKSAKWERRPVKGAKQAGPPEYSGAEPCRLTVEMFFDATLQHRETIVDSVEKLFSCCVPLDKTRTDKKPMPPLVVFKWGNVTSFPAFVTQVDARYTRFAANGVPIRAVCTVNLEEMPAEPGKQNPTSGVYSVDRVHTKIAGDTLALIAYREYGDPALWRLVAAHNGVDDPMRIADGTSIALPPIDALFASVGR
jgi:hypothetical protein